MPDLEPRSPVLDASPDVDDALAAYSPDTIRKVQEAFGAHDRAAILHAGTIIVNCPMGKGGGPMSVLELVENRNQDPDVDHAGEIVLGGVLEEKVDGINIAPEDMIRSAFGKRSLVIDEETHAAARQQPSEIIQLHSSKDSKKK